MDKWEYLRGRISDKGDVFIDKGKDTSFHYLNDLGKNGWELIGTFDRHVIFKRRIPDSPTQTQASSQNTSRAPEVDMDIRF